MAIMLLFHHPVAAVNWQGTGTFEPSNITDIWRYINSNFKDNASSDNIQAFSTGLSTNLNNMWDPAWNVVVVKIATLASAVNDVVLYGYAYKGHWLWYNGWTDSSLPSQQFSFVIWKDYNCKAWKSLGEGADTATGFSSLQQQKMTTLISSVFTTAKLYSDVWKQAKDFVDAVEA